MDRNNERENCDGFMCRSCGSYNTIERPSGSSVRKPSAPKKQYPRNMPKGLDDFLLNFTVSIIERQPTDLEQFAYEYFSDIRTNRNPNHMNSGGPSVVRSSSGGGGGGGIPTIVTSPIETPTNDEITITKEFENFRLAHANQAQGRRFSVFNKAFDPESTSQGSEASEGGIKIQIGSRPSIDDSNTVNNSGSDTRGYEENAETIKNQFYEDQHRSLGKSMSGENQQKIKATLSSIVLFKQMFETQDVIEQSQLIDSMFERVCQRDEIIISQGDEGNYFYVIIHGSFDIYVRSPGANPDSLGKKVNQLKDKGYFGELALLYNQPRSATIICAQDNSVLYCLNRKNFQELMIKNSFKRRQTFKELLKSVPLLNESLTEAEISKVADALSTKVFKPGELIFKQNDEPNGIYFIEFGQVNIIQETNRQKLLLRRLRNGEYFGEVALINKSPRSASAYAAGPETGCNETCRVAFLDLNAFERLMGPCLDLFKSKMVDYKNL